MWVGGERSSIHDFPSQFTPKCSHSQSWARLKRQLQHSLWIPGVDGRTQSMSHLRLYLTRKLDEEQSWEPGTPVWSVGALPTGRAACPSNSASIVSLWSSVDHESPNHSEEQLTLLEHVLSIVVSAVVRYFIYLSLESSAVIAAGCR